MVAFFEYSIDGLGQGSRFFYSISVFFFGFSFFCKVVLYSNYSFFKVQIKKWQQYVFKQEVTEEILIILDV